MVLNVKINVVIVTHFYVGKTERGLVINCVPQNKMSGEKHACMYYASKLQTAIIVLLRQCLRFRIETNSR